MCRAEAGTQAVRQGRAWSGGWSEPPGPYRGQVAVLSVSSVLLPLGDRESQLSSFSPLLLWHSLAFSPLLMQFAAATGSVIARGKEKVLSSVQPFSS